MNHIRLSVLLVLGLAGCAEPQEEGSADGCKHDSCDPKPLICDGSHELRIGFNVAGGQVENTYQFTHPYGWQFFALDGQCHFYASRDTSEGVVEGMLAEAESERLAAELHFWELPGRSGSFGPNCADGSGVSLFTASSQLTCVCGCEGAPAFASAAIEHASTWLDELATRGAPLSGAIRALAKLQQRFGSAFPKYDWPLDTPIEKIAGLTFETFAQLPSDAGVRFEGADSNTLRALRATARAEAKKAETEGRHIESPLIKGPEETLEYKLFLQDELPSEQDSALKSLFGSTLH